MTQEHLNADKPNSSRRAFLKNAGASSSAAILAAGLVATVGTDDASAAQSTGTTSANRLRALLAKPEPIVAPIVYDLMSAKLAQHLGFSIITVGGSSVSSNMFGMGDYGMATVSELVEFSSRMAAGVDVPVIADADDCGGNPLNVYRALKRFARADVACVLIEDMTGAKHVPGRPEGNLSSVAEMSDKIKAGVDAAGPGGPLILARCDALAKDETFDRAMERMSAYSEAGAELVFMSGATPEQHEIVADTIGKPVFSTGNSQRDAKILQAHKVKISAFGIESYALNAIHQVLTDLRDHGNPGRTMEELPRDVTLKLHDAEEWADISRRYNAQSY